MIDLSQKCRDRKLTSVRALDTILSTDHSDLLVRSEMVKDGQ